MRMSTSKVTTISTAFALVAGVTLALSGCSGGPLDGLAQDGGNGSVENSTGADEIIEDATGAEEGSAEDGNTGGDATGGLTYGAVPQEFPSQIPVADGEITGGLYGPTEDGTVWSMSVRSNDPSVFKKLRSQLNSSGFTEDNVVEGETTMGWWQGHGYNVFISAGEDDGAINVGYIVSTSED